MNTRQAAELEPQVLRFFPTPAFVSAVPGWKTVNATLKEIILRKEGEDSGLDFSNVGGWHSGTDFADWGGPALRQVLDAARALAERVTCDRKGRPVKLDWRTECWANVNRKGEANKRHTHPGCLWSGTYYVDTGMPDGAVDLGGQFEFLDPRGAAAAMAIAEHYVFPADSDADAEPLVRPREGKFVMFPSWMPHAVRSYMGESQRISIGFNLAIRATVA